MLQQLVAALEPVEVDIQQFESHPRRRDERASHRPPVRGRPRDLRRSGDPARGPPRCRQWAGGLRRAARSAQTGARCGLRGPVCQRRLLTAADLETFATSPVFWVKLGLVTLLLANGLVLERTESRLRGLSAREIDPRRAAGVCGAGLRTTP